MKPWEPEDPYSLEAACFPGGDPEAVMEALVEEYARFGMGQEAILELFRRPFYRGLHAYWRRRGEEAVREMVARTVGRCGVLRVRMEQASAHTGTGRRRR